MEQHELEKEERDLLTSLERGDWQSVTGLEGEIQEHRQAARATLKKDKRVNIRISSRDLEAIRAKAAEDGIPYQTLMSSVLHRYVAGRLREA
jgi:predicted DNA binding CopG/RHH family protein